ncbi:MAG: acyl-CoA dehydrogenase family protein [Sphingomonas taxi]
MRTIGVAETGIEAMAKRLLSRVAFGKRIADHSVWEERIARARIDIEMTRLLCLKAADMMDKAGNKSAQLEIAMIKVQAPTMALKILDDAIQAHGGRRDQPGLPAPRTPGPGCAPCASPTGRKRSTTAPSPRAEFGKYGEYAAERPVARLTSPSPSLPLPSGEERAAEGGEGVRVSAIAPL